jgi:hypothetical protein
MIIGRNMMINGVINLNNYYDNKRLSSQAGSISKK